VMPERGGDPVTALAEVVIDSLGHRRRYHLAADDLERGVLFGRYDRCQNGSLPDVNVSRVHLLVARTRAGYVAIDTASTNGTERDGRAVRATLLSESSALSLSADTTLYWRQRRHGQA
jgi:pSer/pThr/pTyr-binding forkhead associated (FHA) protein